VFRQYEIQRAKHRTRQDGHNRHVSHYMHDNTVDSIHTFMYTIVIEVGRYVLTNTKSIMIKVQVAFW